MIAGLFVILLALLSAGRWLPRPMKYAADDTYNLQALRIPRQEPSGYG